jgi:PAS domain S-box-containing protein
MERDEAAAGLDAKAKSRYQPRMAAIADWARMGLHVSGPLVTLGAVIALDVLNRIGVEVPNAPVLLLVAVAYSAVRGGLRPAITSSVFVILYALHFYSNQGTVLEYSAENRGRLLVVFVTAPAMALLIGSLRQRELDGAPVMRPEAPATTADAVVAGPEPALDGALDPEISLAAAARLPLPALADWCSIRLLDDEGRLGCMGAAHRSGARNHAARALCALGGGGRAIRSTPSGEWGGSGPTVIDCDDATLRAIADDDDQLGAYRLLAPRQILTVPLRSAGETIGVLELGLDDGARRFGSAEIAGAERLAGTLSLAGAAVRSRRAVAEAEARTRLLFHAHPHPMWIFDVESLGFLDVNEAAVRHYGYSREEFLAMTVIDVTPDDDEDAELASGAERPGPRREEVALARHQRKDGSVIDVEIASQELRFDDRRARLVLVTDVSDRTRTRAALQRSEEQLRKAQKMDAAGRLASGIAHDFNNLLTAIQGYGELLLRGLDANDPRRRDVEEIGRAADRGALLTRQLLAFGRQQVIRPASLDLNGVVSGLESLVQRLVGADVQVETVLTPDLGRVRMDPGQLEQAIVNLVLNARDAMPRGGTLTIETSERAVPPRGRGTRGGRFVVLAVSDSGVGMDEETQAHLFEPFFTTKTHPQGIGLGLAIVHGIVKRAGGVIRVASEPGAGTTVRLYFPRLDDVIEPLADDAAAGSLSGLETVLLVEDERAVRELLRKVLTAHGYTVIEARHGRDALLELERHSGAIHLLVTDVVMPEMGGPELAERMVELRPAMRVLFMSGYTNDEVLQKGIDGRSLAFIQKPFASDEFLRKVREVLDSPQDAGRDDPAVSKPA